VGHPEPSVEAVDARYLSMSGQPPSSMQETLVKQASTRSAQAQALALAGIIVGRSWEANSVRPALLATSSSIAAVAEQN